MRVRAAALVVAAVLISAAVHAQTRRADLQPLPEPPPIPSGAMAEPEPQVTVRRVDGETIEEYRVSGRLVMIRVTPPHGVPYMLTDPRGDGTFTNRRDSIEYPPGVPMWVLFTF